MQRAWHLGKAAQYPLTDSHTSPIHKSPNKQVYTGLETRRNITISSI